MNDHHVYDWIFEAAVPNGTKIETSRWCDDLKPRDGDETNVRSRVVEQQNNVVKSDEVHQGTPPLKVLRMLLALATNNDSHRQKVCGIWDVSVLSFSDRRVHGGAATAWAASAGQAVGSEQGALWNSDGQQVFGRTRSVIEHQRAVHFCTVKAVWTRVS